MSKILKSSFVTFDQDNVISVDVMDASAFELASMSYEDGADEIEDALTEEAALTKAEEIVAEAELEAQRIKDEAIEFAEAETAEMKAKAESEIDKIQTDAYNEAFNNGRTKGKEEAERIIGEAEQIKKDALEEKINILNSAEPEITELVIDLVKHLIGGAFSLKPDLILFLVKQGLSHTSVNGEISIHVSPQDYDNAVSQKADIVSTAEAGSKIEIIKDLSLSPSDCVIETAFGNIDCSLNRQYEMLKENLLFICKNRFAESNEIQEKSL